MVASDPAHLRIHHRLGAISARPGGFDACFAGLEAVAKQMAKQEKGVPAGLQRLLSQIQVVMSARATAKEEFRMCARIEPSPPLRVCAQSFVRAKERIPVEVGGTRLMAWQLPGPNCTARGRETAECDSTHAPPSGCAPAPPAAAAGSATTLQRRLIRERWTPLRRARRRVRLSLSHCACPNRVSCRPIVHAPAAQPACAPRFDLITRPDHDWIGLRIVAVVAVSPFRGWLQGSLRQLARRSSCATEPSAAPSSRSTKRPSWVRCSPMHTPRHQPRRLVKCSGSAPGSQRLSQRPSGPRLSF